MFTQGHRDLVRCLDISSSRIISGDFGGFVRIWSLHLILSTVSERMHKCLAQGADFDPAKIMQHRALLTHRGHVTCLSADATGVVSGSREKKIVWQDFWPD